MIKNTIIKILNEVQSPYAVVGFSYKENVYTLEVINTKETDIGHIFDNLILHFFEKNIEIIKMNKSRYCELLEYGQEINHQSLILEITC